MGELPLILLLMFSFRLCGGGKKCKRKNLLKTLEDLIVFVASAETSTVVLEILIAFSLQTSVALNSAELIWVIGNGS